jgi:hypothetical protein
MTLAAIHPLLEEHVAALAANLVEKIEECRKAGMPRLQAEVHVWQWLVGQHDKAIADEQVEPDYTPHTPQREEMTRITITNMMREAHRWAFAAL